MVAEDFLGVFGSVLVPNALGVEDFADRLNLFTVVLFILAGTVITVKQYVLQSISCYVSVSPTGENFNEFLTSYCWVHGTIPLSSNEQMPNTDQEWDRYDEVRRISESFVRECVCSTLQDLRKLLY
ncbi:Innexin [Fasciola hepatica]|uniref:Innexin n=1 Tax=Fasciola hepatica TaxID=6192 RepID=A0A2H1CPM6_FASHE|nr:Innexin [Fasciola hepatica]